jgi:hypothetical protein
MLIKLKNHSKEIIISEETCIPIDNLLRSFQEKKHILISDREFFKTIIEYEGDIYNYRAKSTASDAMYGQIEYTNLLKSVNFYVIVDFSIKGNQQQWNENGDLTTLTVGPKYFNDSSKLQFPNIIFENLSDNDFYKIIVKHFAKSIKAGNCMVACNAINGGGGTTKDVFDRLSNNNEIVLCLIDNDKKHPKGPAGSTSKAFGKDKFNRTGMVKILDVHEIESLIPIDTIESSIQLTVESSKTINFLRNTCMMDESIKFFFDHKKGLDLRTAIELDHKHGEYWVPLIKASKIVNSSNCLEEKECHCKDPCINIVGLGDNVLTKSVDFINKGNMNAYKPNLSPGLETYWFDIGRLLFSWCCGPYRKARLT